MRLATPTQMFEIEKRTSAKFNISSEVLMENAGTLSAREISTSFMPELQRGRVAIVCGPGNNGGDGLVTARHLKALGYLAADIFLVGGSESSLYDLQVRRAKEQNINVKVLKKTEELANYDIYVDALFGIGLSRHLKEPFTSIVNFINSQKAPVVSLDIPSGLNALSGQIEGACINAQLTLTYGLAKPGLYLAPKEKVGRIRVVPIGLPTSLLKSLARTHYLIDERWARRWLPVRKETSNKFSYGRVYVLAGEPGKWGAAALCCQGAYRAGAGYVTLITKDEETSQKYLGGDLGPEVLITSLRDPEIFTKEAVYVVGPGCGVNDQTKKFIEGLIRENKANVVLDADALTAISQMKLKGLPPSWILTPHAGELSRLLGVSAEVVEADRITYLRKGCERWGCHILLKGFRSLLGNSEGQLGIVFSGNPALAKAGTGDVLSGFMGAMLAGGLKPFAAATTAAYIHGRIADQWVGEGRSIHSLTASDLSILVPDVLSRISRG